ncbi:peptidoglycan bridge formation glycyltransferase FemA/FemB family protein [Patescibacteria group bacterium]|nr:peptidoglycan bridge formation glycyltransferase FemA/FemB family protein [Patescibacteria group bacterium]
MITRILYQKEKNDYNSLVTHPVQTWEWGDFLISQGHKVYRLGVFEKEKIISAYSISFHKISKTNFSIGILQRGPKIDQQTIDNIKKIAQDENAIFVKLEPDVYQKIFYKNNQEKFFGVNMDFPGLTVSPKVAFFPFTYLIDLTKSEQDLLSLMHPKTRYNIKVANRHSVEIVEENNDSGFEIYLKLLFETTKRQGFYLHTEKYHQDLWRILKDTGTMHILLAKYQDKVLAAHMFFALKDKFFYPYGASSNLHREVMASTLLMWEAIKLGKKLKCKSFDMWGSLGPDAKITENTYGFHRFKKGFGGQLVQFVGTYDLVINESLYKLYNIADKYRWKFLRLRAKLLRH